MTPLSMYVGLTGTWRYSASSTSSSEASAMMAPPPGISTGFSASRIISMACRMALDLGAGRSKSSGPPRPGSKSTSAPLFCTSSGRSTRTGPGLPSRAMRNASLKVQTSWAGSLTCTAHFVTGFAISTMSTAWKASLWSLSRNADHGYGVGLAGVEPRDHVRSRRPAGPDVHPDLARYPRVTVCGVRPALFVPHGVVRYALGSAQSLVQRQYGRPRASEDDIHAFVLHYPNDRVHNVHHRHR